MQLALLGPVQVSLAFDLSHLTTFVAAFFGGLMIGGLTEAIAAAIGIQKISKAYVEMVILAVILMGMIDNLSFRTFRDNYFQ